MRFRLQIDKTAEEEVVATVHEPSPLTDDIEALVMKYNKTDKLTAYTADDVRLLPFSEMECLTVIDGKTFAINTKGERLRIKLRLYEVETLVPASFIRINKSTMANIHRLERFTTGYSGGVNAVFCCGHIDYVSRRCFAEIKRRLKK